LTLIAAPPRQEVQPVSYTHLDVYKRQSTAWASAERFDRPGGVAGWVGSTQFATLITPCGETVTSGAPIMAVSYTHLDVYKRQTTRTVDVTKSNISSGVIKCKFDRRAVAEFFADKGEQVFDGRWWR